MLPWLWAWGCLEHVVDLEGQCSSEDGFSDVCLLEKGTHFVGRRVGWGPLGVLCDGV